MTDDQILVTILALSDAPRLPIRADGWRSDLPSVRYDRLRDLAGAGVQLPARGTPAERARQSDRVHQLAQAGLVVHGGATRSAWVRLTPGGETRARALVRPDWRQVSARLVALVAHRLDGSDKWLAETEIPAPPSEVEIDALPALAGGGLVVSSTMRGLAAYRPGPNAESWLAEVNDADLDDPFGPLWEFSRAAVSAELAALAVAKSPDPRELGGIPLAKKDLIIGNAKLPIRAIFTE